MSLDRQFLIQRQTLGVLGIILPFACLLFGILDPAATGTWYGSMSATYFTNARDIFVAVLMMTGAFLITYAGYDWRDRLVNISAGILAMGIALFPTSPSGLNVTHIGLFSLPVPVASILHNICAVIFFGLLALNILWLFTKGDIAKGRKKLRNQVYMACGWGIIGMFIITAIGMYFNFHVMWIWIVEAIMLIFFGIAWLTKGRAIKILNDI